MPILILNITGNSLKFENQFCDDLKKRLGDLPCVIKHRISTQLLEYKEIIDDNYKIVIILSHTWKCDDGTIMLNTGLKEDFVSLTSVDEQNSITILTQTLNYNRCKFIIFFCACEMFSNNLIMKMVTGDNLIGKIASSQTINADYISVIAQVIRESYDCIIKELTDNDKRSCIKQIVNKYSRIFKFEFLD